MTRSTITSRLRQGKWQRLHVGVYAVFSGPPGRDAQMWAAVLGAGSGAVLSHQSAAVLDKLTESAGDAVHVTIPAQRRISRQPGMVVHLSDRASAVRHPSRLPPRTRLEETVLDLAVASKTLDEAVGWVTKALGRRLTTQAKLADALASRPKVRWRRDLTAVLAEDMTGALSVLEYRYVRDVERPHGLPPGQRQAVADIGGSRQYRDVEYEQYRLVIELDGMLAHPAEMRWQDIHRDNAAAAASLTTLRYGWIDITSRPCEVAAEIAAVLAQRGYNSFGPCAPDCRVRQVSTQRREA
jgi:hypothetical protein